MNQHLDTSNYARKVRIAIGPERVEAGYVWQTGALHVPNPSAARAPCELSLSASHRVKAMSFGTEGSVRIESNKDQPHTIITFK